MSLLCNKMKEIEEKKEESEKLFSKLKDSLALDSIIPGILDNGRVKARWRSMGRQSPFKLDRVSVEFWDDTGGVVVPTDEQKLELIKRAMCPSDIFDLYQSSQPHREVIAGHKSRARTISYHPSRQESSDDC